MLCLLLHMRSRYSVSHKPFRSYVAVLSFVASCEEEYQQCASVSSSSPSQVYEAFSLVACARVFYHGKYMIVAGKPLWESGVDPSYHDDLSLHDRQCCQAKRVFRHLPYRHM